MIDLRNLYDSTFKWNGHEYKVTASVKHGFVLRAVNADNVIPEMVWELVDDKSDAYIAPVEKSESHIVLDWDVDKECDSNESQR